jgi:hypothetical protein
MADKQPGPAGDPLRNWPVVEISGGFTWMVVAPSGQTTTGERVACAVTNDSAGVGLGVGVAGPSGVPGGAVGMTGEEAIRLGEVLILAGRDALNRRVAHHAN